MKHAFSMQITEIFYSIQGEGILTGLPTIFIRTTGCNLHCSYCDTPYANEGGENMTVKQILSIIKKYQCSSICITGGEPLLQQETKKLITALQKNKYFISVETNGSQPISQLKNRNNLMISMDIKTPSSKMQSHFLKDNLRLLTKKDQIKCIIQNKKDYDYAKRQIIQNHLPCPIIFQPVWGTSTADLASWILQDHLPVRLGIQLHKFVWGEKTHR